MPEGILKGGGASRSESNESIAGGNRTADTSALRRELAAVSASLSRILSPFLGGTRKGPPEGPSPNTDRAVNNKYNHNHSEEEQKKLRKAP